jgi:hypothetical protein
MKLKTDALLEQLINDGINAALGTCDQLDEFWSAVLRDQLNTEIWLQLDTYFDFE